jgi:hypothetical protein
MGGHKLNRSVLGQGRVAESCDCNEEHLSSIKSREFLD